MFEQFNIKITNMQKEFRAHPHAKIHAHQTKVEWSYSVKSITQTNKQPFSSIVALYNNRIVSCLLSIHNMF
ncbi:MAG: hypothetical protein QS721_09370 [Candidatus Endonucleobacter sp. (ex Gigantidas childressi)]|nr:hypothetical protein [Candidatus Endonucleobacter sp. (ex Gigantidas childressi)]